MPEYTITPFHRENLEKLVAGLKALPEDYGNFCMDTFGDEEEGARAATPGHPCNTSACVVGHGPYFGVPVLKGEGFFDYSYRCFIPHSSTPGPHRGRWGFCFGVYWPDSVPEAIARLELYLGHKAPEHWSQHDLFSTGESK